MIVRNEAGLLPVCLASAADLAQDVVVVDTGSADDTRAVAAAHGARVFDFPWRDDFAAARNEALRHAQGDWVLWLDADESLDEPDRHKLRHLLASLGDDRAAFVMQQRSPSAAGGATVVHQVRLFRNLPSVRWEYRVHEQLLPSSRRAGHDVRWTDLVVQHSGYHDAAHSHHKPQRNLRLLRLDHAQRPDDAFVLFNLGWALVGCGQPAEALVYLRRSLATSQPGDSLVRKLYALLAGCHRRLGQHRDALAACRAGRARCPDDVELLFLEGTLLADHGDAAGAERCWRLLLPGEGVGLPPSAGGAFASYDEGLRGYLTRHQLARLCQAQGRPAEAEAHWRAALAEAPGFLAARVDLGDLLRSQERWDDLEALAAGAGDSPAAVVEAAVLRARALLGRQDYEGARRLLTEILRFHPDALKPLVVLTYVLLQEGLYPSDAERAPSDAERALRAVLERDPRQDESWANLAVLLRNLGRLGEAVAACQSGRVHCPEDQHLLLLHGLYSRERGDLVTAESCLLRVLEAAPSAGPGRERAWTARHHLALVCRAEDRAAEAVSHWRALLAEAPQLTAAWVELGGTYLSLGRLAEAEQAAEALSAGPGVLEGLCLKARVLLERKDYPEARRLLEEAIGRFPLALDPRILRSYALLQEDRDPAAAEKALRDVLTHAPDNAEARRNLAVLQRRHSPISDT
jgi:tetratricopeptide (TPR) repeat protein